jgi:hypothetical protein
MPTPPKCRPGANMALINNPRIQFHQYCSSSYVDYSINLYLSSPPMGGREPHCCCSGLCSCTWLSALFIQPPAPMMPTKIEPTTALNKPTKAIIELTMAPTEPLVMAPIEPSAAPIKPTKAPMSQQRLPLSPRRLQLSRRQLSSS